MATRTGTTRDPAVAAVLRSFREDVAEATRHAYEELEDMGFDPDTVLRGEGRRARPVRVPPEPVGDGNVVNLMVWLAQRRQSTTDL